LGLESYEIGERLIEAHPSTFFAAKNAVLQSEVILRRLWVDPARADDVRDTFYREQRLSAALRHPRIMRPVEVFEADGALWSVHDFRRQRITESVIRADGPLPVGEAARYGAQVADGLAHMHEEGYVHGKVSPTTVTFDELGDALVVSLVKSADLAAGIWPLRPAVLGLSPYSAPEELAGERPTPASDLYGLAATVFFWLTGAYPRGGDSEAEGLERVRMGVPLLDLAARCPEAPPVLVRRLENALEMEPSRRRGSLAALGDVLVEIHQRLASQVPSGFRTGMHLEACGLPGGVEVLGVHGGGAFGVVLRARSASDGRTVAVKALKPEHRDNHEVHERFLREARMMHQVCHPNVVGIRAVGETKGIPFAVMEFVDGPDLATLLLREGALPPVRAARLGAGVARGLQAIHEQGIVHRDLKPHNILVAATDRAVITDFGVARQASAPRLTLTGQITGTPLYMAPELFESGEASPSGDLYALGTILYELLTGTVPFPAADPVQAIRRIRSEPPPALPGSVPPALAAVVLRLLEKDPADRFASALEAAAALESLVDPVALP